MPQVLGREYQCFEGNSYRNLMPQLMESGFVPMTVAEVMKARLEVFSSGKRKEKNYWRSHGISTSDGGAYYDGNVKIVHYAQTLKNIQPTTKLSALSLTLTPKRYKDLDAEEFSLGELESAGLLYQDLSIQEVKSHPIWKALAEDEHLLSEYTDVIFAEIKQIFGTNKAMAMGVNYVLFSGQTSKPIMRSWDIDNLGGSSDVAAGFLSNDLTNLVGIRAYKPNDVVKARQELEKLKEVAGPANVKSLEELLRKL